MYAKQAFSLKSHTSRSAEVLEACEVLLKEIEDLKLERGLHSWTVLDWLVPVKTFPVHNAQFCEDMLENAMLFEKCRQVSLFVMACKLTQSYPQYKLGNASGTAHVT